MPTCPHYNLFFPVACLCVCVSGSVCLSLSQQWCEWGSFIVCQLLRSTLQSDISKQSCTLVGLLCTVFLFKVDDGLDRLYRITKEIFTFFFFSAFLCCPLILSPAERFKFSINLRKKLWIKPECTRIQKITYKRTIVLIKKLTYVKFADRSHLN